MILRFISGLGLIWLGCGAAAVAQSATPAEPGYRISGKVEGGTPGRYVRLKDLNGKHSTTLDSTALDASGRFELRGSLPEAAVYFVQFDTLKAITLTPLSPGSELTYAASLRHGKKALEHPRFTLTGSPDVALLDAFNALFNKYPKLAIARLRGSQALPDDAYMAATRQLVRQHPASPVAAYWTLRNLSRFNEQRVFVDSMTTVFRRTMPASRYSQQLAELTSKMPALLPLQPAPELRLQTPTGQPLLLSSLRGKYVLLDFWASWCAPCRAENPELVRFYKNYQPKGLEIVGVSLDDSYEKWKRAIQTDGLPWLQGSDLQGWQSPAGKAYNVIAVPQTVLIDPQGRIVAMGLRGKALDQKLAEVLQ